VRHGVYLGCDNLFLCHEVFNAAPAGSALSQCSMSVCDQFYVLYLYIQMQLLNFMGRHLQSKRLFE
jgi:hypothetical protein